MRNMRDAAKRQLQEPPEAENEAPAATGNLFVVSNRLPLSVKQTEEGFEFNMSSGGLVSAMLGVMEDESMTWIGWPGISVDEEKDREKIRTQLADDRCVPVFLDETTQDEYYNGFCNSVIWPLFHYVQDVLDTNPLQEQWDAYVRANEAFCEVILPKLNEGDTVWVHDYHLMLLPTMLKSKMPSLRVGWFLHTPFPTSEVFRMLPMRDKLMRGLLGADLLGFHTSQYVRHFLQAAQRAGEVDTKGAVAVAANKLSLRIPRDMSAVQSAEGDETAEGNSVEEASDFAHTAQVGAFPIGIAPDRFEEELKTSSCRQAIRTLRDRFGDRKIMLGVDRLDPIKGIPHKLLAFEKLLETHPEYIGEVVLVQIAVPSRLDVPLHKQLQERLHSLAGRINGRFGSLGWVPIHYLDTSVSFDDLVALYAASSAMVISSLRDGMNLVSFEWTVCQEHKRGRGSPTTAPRPTREYSCSPSSRALRTTSTTVHSSSTPTIRILLRNLCTKRCRCRANGGSSSTRPRTTS
jgi:trehalose 6-phosphate synthase/phosphatase